MPMNIKDFLNLHFSSRENKGRTCLHCSKFVAASNYERFISHLKSCSKATSEIRRDTVTYSVTKASNSTVVFSSPIETQDALNSNSLQSNKHQRENDSNSELLEHETNLKKSKNMDSFICRTTEAQKRMIDVAIARFVFTTGIPFSVASSKLFAQVFAVARPSYKPPGRNKLSTTLLDECYNDDLEQCKKQVSEAEAVVVISDGWSNLRNDHIVNFVLQIEGISRPVFYKSIVTGEVQQTSQNIFAALDSVITEIGYSKVVGILTDNAPNMRGAWRLTESKYPMIFANGCASHVGNLICKDILKIPDYRICLDFAVTITNFVQNRERMLARFRNLQKSASLDAESPIKNIRGLETPVETRWYSANNCMCRVFENRYVFGQLIADKEFLNTFKSSQSKLNEFVEAIQNNQMWDQLRDVILILKPVISMIGEMEKDSNDLSMVYKEFLHLYNYSFPDNVQAIIDRRWKFIHTNSMSFSYLLNPHNEGGKNMIDNDLEVTILQLHEFCEQNLLSERNLNISGEITGFLQQFCDPSSSTIALLRRFTAGQWWAIFGHKQFPILSVLAKKLFAIPTSSAASERIWSTFDFIHSK